MLFEFPYLWNEPVEKHFLLCQYKIGTTRFRIANEYQNTEYHYVKYHIYIIMLRLKRLSLG